MTSIIPNDRREKILRKKLGKHKIIHGKTKEGTSAKEGGASTVPNPRATGRLFSPIESDVGGGVGGGRSPDPTTSLYDTISVERSLSLFPLSFCF